LYNAIGEIKAKLDTITEAKTYYSYPPDFINLPSISLTESNNIPDKLSEGIEVVTDYGFTIDIWTKTIPDMYNLRIIVDQKINEMGFRRIYGTEVPDIDIKHYTLRYSGKIDKRNNLVFQ
jgi:hypothetical protein